MKNIITAIIFTVCSSLAINAQTQSISINFQAVVGDKVFDCRDSYDGIGTTESKMTVSDFRIYIQDARRVSGNSPYDQFRFQGKKDAISDSAKRGEQLFFSERTECFDCHAGLHLSGTVNFTGKQPENAQFENNGLYNLDGKGAYPKDNTGIFEFTGKRGDMGKFKVPSLRNVEITAPYMHDGSIATLEEVIEHYSVGGRTIKTGEFGGIDSENPFKSSFVRGFDLTVAEKQDLIAFLKSLTDSEFVSDPKLKNPWEKK